MPDPFAYCAELLRAADHDRYIATLFAPAEHRGALYALYAFNSEVARVREVVRQPLAGEIRLQWWSDVLSGERQGEANAHPVASALLSTIARHRLDAARLIDLVEARRFDLYDEPMAGMADLQTYAEKTASALFALAAQILAGTEMNAAAEPAGLAYGMVGVLHAFPLHAARGQLYLPMELLDRHQVLPRDIFSSRSSPGLEQALAELRSLSRAHLTAARDALVHIVDEARPAFLPVALVRPLLERMDRVEPFALAEIARWRRQWLIWRAARNPARISG